MHRRLFALVAIAFGSANSAFAHQDISYDMEFGNVKVRITTGYDYEEISKVAIIGELAQRLSERMDYHESVFLDFDHYYVKDYVSDPLIWFGAGTNEMKWYGKNTKPSPLPPGIVVRQTSSSFNAATTLKLLEYSMSHVADIKRDQRVRTYADKYRRWQARSIDKKKIRRIVAARISSSIEEAWQKPVVKPGTDPNAYAGISYRFEKGEYIVYCWHEQSGEKRLMSLEDIYDFREISNNKALVFDTRETFYFVSDRRKPCSKRHRIKDTHDYFKPYEVQSLGYDKIAISFSYFVPSPPGSKLNMAVKSRTLIYHPEEDDLAQDLDELLKKR